MATAMKAMKREDVVSTLREAQTERKKVHARLSERCKPRHLEKVKVKTVSVTESFALLRVIGDGDIHVPLIDIEYVEIA